MIKLGDAYDVYYFNEQLNKWCLFNKVTVTKVTLCGHSSGGTDYCVHFTDNISVLTTDLYNSITWKENNILFKAVPDKSKISMENFSKMQDAEMKEFLKKQEKELLAFQEKQKKDLEREQRRAEERKQFEDFKSSLINSAIDEYSFSQKQAEMIFSRAWEEGHSCGYNEVRICFEDLADFINDLIH